MDQVTAELLRRLGSKGELAWDLAYRLFDLREKENRPQKDQAYNALVLGSPETSRLAREAPTRRQGQGALFEDIE